MGHPPEEGRTREYETAPRLRCGHRAAVRRNVPRRGHHPRRLRPVAPPNQLALTRPLRSGADRQLHARGPPDAGLSGRHVPRAPARKGLRLVAVFGGGMGGLLGAGILVTDPVSGYPPGAPDRLSEYGWHGALHDLFSLAAFGALAAAGPCSAAGSSRRVSAGGRSNRPSAASSSP